MENMDKGPTVPKWVLIVWPKIPQMPQNLSAQFVCPSQKVLDFNEKRLYKKLHSSANLNFLCLPFKELFLGRQFGQINFWAFGGILGQFIHFDTVSPLSMFSIIKYQPLFLQKPMPLYPNPKYLFRVGI